jgi:hypothetical protein
MIEEALRTKEEFLHLKHVANANPSIAAALHALSSYTGMWWNAT